MNQNERMEKITEYINRDELSMESDFDVCHYTDANGLFGIISNKSLRFTNKKYLNDVMEDEYWKKIVVSAIEKYGNSDNNTEVEQFFANILNKENEYILSLSTEIDNVNQWHYGKEQGYGIVFSKDLLAKAINDQNVGCLTGIVNYNSEIQELIIDYLLELYITSIRFRPLLEKMNTIIDISQAEIQTNAFTSLFKQPCHFVEKEIRYIVQCNESAIQHRIRNGIFTPYCEISLELPIKQIIVGPGKDQEIAEKGVISLLTKNGIKNVQITKSEIKLR